MLKLNPNPTFLLKVGIPVPGQVNPTDIKLVVKYRNLDDLQDFSVRLDAQHLKDSLLETVQGWEGVDAPFSADALLLLCNNYPSVGPLIINEYFNEIHKARIKN